MTTTNGTVLAMSVADRWHDFWRGEIGEWIITRGLRIVMLVIAAILMTVFVLLHKGKGGGLSSLFGGGVQSNLSGSTVVEKNLDRYTVVMVIIWLACIVGLNLIQAFA